MRRFAIIGCAVVLFGAAEAHAGEFDSRGAYLPDPEAVARIDFGTDFDPVKDYYVSADSPETCVPSFEQIEGADALDGEHFLHVNTLATQECAERFLFKMPPGKRSYRARAWVRHGNVDLQVNVAYAEGATIDPIRAKLGPTGRVTSDGWVELASNAFPVHGDLVDAAYLRVIDFDDVFGSDVDAFEIALDPSPYWESQACYGYGDPVCGEGAVCNYRKCVLGRPLVPVVPDEPIRSAMVDSIQGQMRTFFGGRKTRLENLPEALARLESIRDESDGYRFWNGWGHAMRLLQDWHTSPNGSIEATGDRDKRINACFFEGDADLSQAQWPSHPAYPDVLVSHVGVIDTQGLIAGDRVVSIDGKHPIEWALSLTVDDWGWWRANTDGVYSELLERLRGFILRYAREYSVIHCNAATQTCDAVPTTYRVADLPGEAGQQVRCDNRPFYHLSSNPGENHNVGFNFFRGQVTESTDEEAIYGLVWDTLYGGGEPNGHVNGSLKDAFADFKANARGVVLDHRAGSGGTLDGAETATFLILPPTPVLVFTSPIEFGAWDGPETQAEGVVWFDKFKTYEYTVMTAGDAGYDPAMPVALLTHRDGSASDFMPYAFKGASPKVRIFGPTATAGAFSTYYNLQYWGGITLQFASGDSIGADGSTLIGHGVVPDVIVKPKQSDLLAGKDSVHEAALAWLRTELKP